MSQSTIEFFKLQLPGYVPAIVVAPVVLAVVIVVMNERCVVGSITEVVVSVVAVIVEVVDGEAVVPVVSDTAIPNRQCIFI